MTISDKAAGEHLDYRRLDILHVLRGFSAFYVVVFHAKFVLWVGMREYMNQHPRATWGALDYLLLPLDLLSSAGYEMVVLFFVLSGFFIRYSQEVKPRKALAFYKNRILRIYPPYLFSIALGCAILLFAYHFSPQLFAANLSTEFHQYLRTSYQDLGLELLFRSLIFLPIGILYIGMNAAYWSLLHEGVFYVLVPLVFRHVKLYFWISLVLYVLGFALFHFRAPSFRLELYVFQFNFFFALGAQLYDVVRHTAVLAHVKRLPAFAWLAAAALLMAAIIGLSLLKLKGGSGLLAGVLAVVLVLYLLGYRLQANQNWLLQALHRLGVFSYTLYLCHFPLLILTYALLSHFAGQVYFYSRVYWLGVVVATLGSWLIFQVTEKQAVAYFRKV